MLTSGVPVAPSSAPPTTTGTEIRPLSVEVVIAHKADTLGRFRIGVSSAMTVKQLAFEAVKRLAKLQQCTCKEIRVASVSVEGNGCFLFGDDSLMSVVDIRTEQVRVSLSQPLGSGYKDMFVIQQTRASNDHSMDLFHQPQQQTAAAMQSQQNQTQGHRAHPMQRASSLDMCTPNKEDSGEKECAPAAHRPPVAAASTKTTAGSSTGAEKKPRTTSSGEPQNKRKSSSSITTKQRNVERKIKEEKEDAEAENVSPLAPPSHQVPEGWGREAYKYFDPNYVSNPDAILREKRRAKRQRLEEEEEKKKARATTVESKKGGEQRHKGTAQRNTVAAKPINIKSEQQQTSSVAGPSVAGRPTLPRVVMPVEREGEQGTVRRRLFDDSDEPAAAPNGQVSPIVSSAAPTRTVVSSTASGSGAAASAGRQPEEEMALLVVENEQPQQVISSKKGELKWGSQAAEKYGTMYIADPSKMTPNTRKLVQEAPREKRVRKPVSSALADLY